MTSAPIVSHFQRQRQQARIRWLSWGRRPPLHQRGRHVCPLLFPEETGQVCPIEHQQWPKGGCTTRPTSIGARVRYQIDRDSQAYRQVYKQHTADEHVNENVDPQTLAPAGTPALAGMTVAEDCVILALEDGQAGVSRPTKPNWTGYVTT